MSKPNITIPTEFATNGVKTDFTAAKISDGFNRLNPDVLAGDNLNKFIDDTYKGLNGTLELFDGCVLYDVNNTYHDKSIVFDIDNNGKMHIYRSLINNNIGNPLTDTTAWEEGGYANQSLSNLNTDAHFNVLRPLIHSRMIIRTAGVMATWGSRTFSKAYDDECIGAVVIDASGYGSICLVSETERGATGYDAYDSTPRTTGTVTYYGKTFYYFVSQYAIPIAEGLTKNNNLIPVCPHRLSGSENIALAVLDMAYTNIRYSIPEVTYVSGTWGYRIWGDGWKEFWGRATTTSAGQQLTITTPIGMNNNQYALVIQQLRGNTGNDAYPHITAINATNFSFKGDSNAENIWYACGY